MVNKLSALIEKIEQQLSWGKGDQWSIHDFEALREEILKVTGQAISVTTLKRVWGKARQDNTPSKSTLNILAQFAGFQNWNHFSQDQSTTQRSKKKFSILSKGLLYLTLVCSIVFLGWLLFFSNLLKQNNSIEQVQFSVHTVGEGFPTPVRFDYEFKNQSLTGVELNQDQLERSALVLTEPKGSISSTYYFPGYYQPQIVRNGVSLNQQNLLIPTAGWLGLLKNASVNFPIYLPKDQLQSEPHLSFGSANFSNLSDNPEYANLWLSNLSAKPLIDGRNFTFSCEVRMPVAFYNSPCKVATISIQGTNESIDFGFCIPNCTGGLTFNFAGQTISGSTEELSQFGINLSDWVKLKVEVLNNELKIEVEDTLYQTKLLDSLGLVGGITFIFDGLGEAKNVQFRDAKQTLKLTE